MLKKDHIRLDSEEAWKRVLKQIEDNDENAGRKKLIKRIRDVQNVDLNIIRDFMWMQSESIQYLKKTVWFQQIENFCKNYDQIKHIQVDGMIDIGNEKFITLLRDSYVDEKMIYSRMFHIVPERMSSGEIAMINIFATLHSALQRNTSGNILLILDELDAFLHPKWQQEILWNIVQCINESEKFNNKKIQLIVATHSPIILSDIFKSNIIYLKKPFEVVKKKKLTFGANVRTLFYDSFFMEEGSIGRIARTQIQWAIDKINDSERKLDIADKKKLVYIIDNIGDRFLREHLKTNPVYIESLIENEGEHGKD